MRLEDDGSRRLVTRRSLLADHHVKMFVLRGFQSKPARPLAEIIADFFLVEAAVRNAAEPREMTYSPVLKQLHLVRKHGLAPL